MQPYSLCISISFVLGLNFVGQCPCVFNDPRSVYYSMCIKNASSHHLSNDNHLGPQLFVDCKDMDETKGEDHEIQAQNGAS